MAIDLASFCVYPDNRMYKNNLKSNKQRLELGFTTVEILLSIIVVVLIGAVGWLVYSNGKDDSPQSTNVSKVAEINENKSDKTNVNTLKIPEFGVKLVNIPNSLKDLTYTTTPGTDNAYIAASFDTKTLAAKCGVGGWIGTINRYPGVFSKDQENNGQLSLIKQFDGFWLGILNIGGVPCNENTDTVDFQSSQISTFKQFASNPANWQSD